MLASGVWWSTLLTRSECPASELHGSSKFSLKKLSRQRWTILNNSDRIKGIFNFSRNKIILFELNPMLFIVWNFWISHLHEADRKISFILCLLCIHARRKTWRQVAKNMIKKNNSLELIKFFKRNQPADSFCRMDNCKYLCRLESY